MTSQDKSSKILEVLKVVLLPIAIAVVGATFSWFQQQSAMEKQYLDRVAFLLEDLASDDSVEKALAITYMRALANEGKITEEFAEDLAQIALEQALGQEDDREVQDSAVARAVEKSFESVTRQVVEELPARIFLHIPDESVRQSAQRLRDLLEDNAYRVPGIELVDASPAENELRFLTRSDESLAGEIEELLAGEGYVLHRVDLSGRYEGAVRPKTFEIWFAAPE